MSLKLTIDIADINGLQSILDKKQNVDSATVSYVLPIASTTKLGGIKIGANLNITSDGTLSANTAAANSYTLPKASSTVLGGIKIGSGFNVSADGTLSVIQSTGNNGIEGQIIPLIPQIWGKIYQPPYYGITYDNNTTQGRYFAYGLSTNEGVNFSTNRPDPVYTIAAYNIATPNGNREFLNESAWDMSIETHYDTPGIGIVYGDFEAHLFRQYDIKGREHRHLSGYFNCTSGVGRWDMVADALNLMHPNTHGEQPFVWATLSQAQLTLQPVIGGGASIYMFAPDGQSRVTFSYIGGNPILDMAGAFYTDGFGNTRIKVGTYANDAEAAANGIKLGYNYYTRINGKLMLTIREI